MSVFKAAGQTYADYQISVGTTVASTAGNAYTYTETSQQNPDSLTIGQVGATGSTFSFTYVSGTGTGQSTVSADAVVLANSEFGIIFTAMIAGISQTFYVTNTAAEQPGIGNSVLVPGEVQGRRYVAPCYCPGTLIRTDRGDVAVEDLAVGDLLVTVSGELKPVRWIGRRSYDGRFFAGNQAVWPVRFRAGSLGTDATGAAIPSRDLLVSPKHAMLIDGVLVPAELLVDGVGIRRDGSARAVTYIHVELPEHDAIWAENTASETFLNDDSREMFQNAGTYALMYPGAVEADPVFCAPRLEGGRQLAAIRARIAHAAAPVALAA